MSKKKKRSPRYSGINKHKRSGKNLKTGLSELNIKPFDWDRDGIPEYLWIEYLIQCYGDNPNTNYFNDLLDVIESELDEDIFLLGTLSSFDLVPKNKRNEIVEKYTDLIIDAFAEPIGRLLSLYDDHPAKWLIPNDWIDGIKIDQEEELEKLEASLIRLFQAKDYYTGHLRMFPLIRIIKNGKMHFPKGAPIVDILPRYPHACSEDEKMLAQSLSRTTVNMFLMGNDFPGSQRDRNWAKHFWRKNFEISKCRTGNKSVASVELPEKFYKELYKGIEENIYVTTNYLDKLSTEVKIDLYSPDEEEVIFGLLARIVRLYKILLTDQELWSLDLSRIHLRCLVDTAITVCYLVKNNDSDLFNEFIKYGIGKEKLLMLHLQDTHPEETGPSGEGFEDVSKLFADSFSPEYTDIDLGSWINKSTRDMAIAVDLIKEYRLIYDPTSSDIHGTWPSVKNHNLKYCANPLHRFHKLPNTNEPPKTIYPLSIANSLIEKVVNFCSKHRGYPTLEDDLFDFSELKKLVPNEEAH